MENIGCRQVAELCGEKWMKNQEHARRVYSIDYCSPTLSCCGGGNLEAKIQNYDYSIRKITPKECFRLMGFSDEDYDKCKEVGMSDSQIYKQAGNSIVVNVLEKIFEKMI